MRINNKIFIIKYISSFFILFLLVNYINTQYDNNLKLYNEGNKLYKLGDFDKAFDKYNFVGTGKNELLDRYNLYNLGNSLYRIGENIDDNSKKIELWEKSISSYKESLKIEEDNDARYNLELLQKKLQEEKKKIKEQTKKDNQNTSQNKDSSNKGKDKSGNDKSGNNDKKSNENTEKTSEGNDKSGSNDKKSSKDAKKTSEGKNKDVEGKNNTQNTESKEDFSKQNQQGNNSNNTDNKNSLNKEQLQAIENYKQELQKQQKEYGQYYNKNYQEKKNNDPFDNFFDYPFSGDPFFDNSSLYNNGEETKDW